MALGDGIGRNKGRKGYAFQKGYNTAISEFAERLHELCGVEIGDYQYSDLLHESKIDEIAEELKGVVSNESNISNRYAKELF